MLRLWIYLELKRSESFGKRILTLNFRKRLQIFDFDDLAVNAYIETALQILDRIKWVNAKKQQLNIW